MEIIQYTIVLVNLDPTVASEIKKTRPCVIVSPDEMNRHLRTVMIAPMTTTSKPYPTRVKVSHQGKTEWIVLDQLRTIDRSRIIKVYKSLTQQEIQEVKQTIREAYVD